MKAKWEDLGSNQVLRGKGFYISFNPDTGADHMGSLLTSFGNALGADLKDGTETALCKDGVFKILTGDWRKAYEKVVPSGYDACSVLFDANKAEFGNEWSTLAEDRPRGGI